MRKKCTIMIIPSVVCLVMFNSLNLADAEEADAVLDEVVVQSTSIPDYQVTTEVITAEKIKEMGATNVAEAVAKVPGLYVAYNFKGATMVRIRGAASDQTKIYVDGMPVFPMAGIASNYAANLGAIPVENIEKIEIIKGPGPVQYGTDYKGGMILITTKDGKGHGQTNLHFAAGSHSSYDNYISYSGSNDNFSYFLTAGRQQSDGYLRNTEFSENYFNGKLKWNVGNDTFLTLSGYSVDTDREIANPYDPITGAETNNSTNWSTTHKRNADGTINPAKNATTATRDWKHTGNKQSNIALQFDHKVNNRFKYNVKAYHVRDDDHLWVYNVYNAQYYGLITDHYADPIWYLSNWSSGGDGFEFTGDWLTARNNTVTFGAKYTDIDWSSTENNSDLDEHGIDKRFGYYVQDAVQLDDATKLTLGVRIDEAKQTRHYSKTGDTTVDSSSKVDATDPVLNITHHLDDKNELRFSAGKTHIFVTAKQAASNIQQNQPIPDPEKAKNYELGWAHSFDDKSSLDVAVFKNDVTDRINSRPDGTLKGTYYNVGETNIKGVEIAYNREFSKRLKGFVNYAYQHAEDTSQTGVVTRSANLPQNIVNYGLTYTADKFQTSLYGHILSDVPTNSTTNPRLDSYSTVDLDFRYNGNENTEYFLRISNLFDEKYWETSSYPSDGINFLMGVNVKM